MPKERVKDKLKSLPKEPGVYFYKDATGKIIYIGKASILRNRVRQYFQNPKRLDYKTQLLVADIADVDWLVVGSEIEALFLESEMIKRYLPKYNIDLRDDKHYQYIRIPMKETYPAVSFVRRPMDDGATYFGPYIQGSAMRKALKYLRRIFPYSTHTFLPKRVCLQYHIGLCPGVEEAKITSKAYKKNLRKLIMYLKGERSKLVKILTTEMNSDAKAQKFEQAAILRNQVHNLQALNKQIIFSDKEMFDISRDQALNGLVDLLDLKGIPKRIETYDISHMQGTHNVASMVVFNGGIPAKGEYRKFKMRTPGNDDFAHMREVMTRRFSGKNIEAWPKPDLLVIDGGKGQLSSVLSVLDELKINIPAIGLAKREEEIVRQTPDGFTLTLLDKNSHVLKLLMRMRDEAHRFAVTYHTTLRNKAQTHSYFEDIPGIGPATRRKLIREFGSLRGVVNARQGELENLLGVKKATVLRQYLRPLRREQK